MMGGPLVIIAEAVSFIVTTGLKTAGHLTAERFNPQPLLYDQTQVRIELGANSQKHIVHSLTRLWFCLECLPAMATLG
jgi:hypothetical protein